MRNWLKRSWHAARRLIRRGQIWSRRHLPPGLRLPVGLVLICAGLLSFLPVFGLWMLPLGIAIAALDVKPLLRWCRGLLRRPPRDGKDDLRP